MSDNVYTCGICEQGEGEFIADNNADRTLTWYCGACEDTRAERYGCALIIAEGVMCDEGACGCDGTGILRVEDSMIKEWHKDNREVAR